MVKHEDEMMDDDEMETGSNGEKMMTMDDVAERLQKDFHEEIEDANKYLCMAKIADCACDCESSHYLLEMAKDEYTHACFIHSFMEQHNMCIPEHHEHCYQKLESKMARFL